MARISETMVSDHARLRALLRVGDFEAFRAGLLRHIGIEEKILLPALRQAGWEDAALSRLLRADHGVIATLLVPTPTDEIRAALAALLDVHDRAEEGEQGLYAACDRRLSDDLVATIEAVHAPPLAPHFDGPRAREKLADALAYVRRRTGAP
jgi:hypothetical protein